MTVSSKRHLQDEPVAPSNGVRLSPGEWAFVGLVAAFVAWLVPASADPHGDDLVFEADVRIPHELNEDYWSFRRLAGRATRDAEVVVLGDSVVWGAYVRPDETLSAHLSSTNRRAANLGVQGAHPAALAGLITYHGEAIRDRTVVVQLNPLWMSSMRLDLREDKEVRLNHPELIPQFDPWLPSYKASVDERLGAVVRRYVPLLLWTRHVQRVAFEGLGVPEWTMEHPGANPIDQLLIAAPLTATAPRHGAESWTDRGIRPQRYSWVEPEESVQFGAMRRVVETLRARGNRVVALVGPLNAHALEPRTRANLGPIRHAITAWLREEGVAYLAPAPLPSEEYADVSHPLAAGYARLAAELHPLVAPPR